MARCKYCPSQLLDGNLCRSCNAHRAIQGYPLDDDVIGELVKVSAAAVLLDGKVYSLSPPARHHSVIHWMVGDLGLGPQTGMWEEGFLLSDGRFARRKPAWIIAERAGQIIRQTGPHGTLYSEDVW